MLALGRGAYTGKVPGLSQAGGIPAGVTSYRHGAGAGLMHDHAKVHYPAAKYGRPMLRCLSLGLFIGLAFGFGVAQDRIQKIDSILSNLNQEEAFSGRCA